LQMVKTALTQRKSNPDIHVPWTGFDLINAFNAWKRSANAGRIFAVGSDGVAEVVATGLSWRREVSAQAFEEAAVDCGGPWPRGRTRDRASARASRWAFRALRRKRVRWYLFACATSTPNTARRRSGLVIIIEPARGRCPVSGKSGYTMTLADCGA
jgi:putative transposase